MVRAYVRLLTLTPSVSIVVVAFDPWRLFLQNSMPRLGERPKRSLYAAHKQVMDLERSSFEDLETDKSAPSVPLRVLLVILVLSQPKSLIKGVDSVVFSDIGYSFSLLFRTFNDQIYLVIIHCFIYKL